MTATSRRAPKMIWMYPPAPRAHHRMSPPKRRYRTQAEDTMDRSSQPRGPFNPVPAGDHSILRAEIALMLPLFYWRSRCELGLTACPFAVRRTDNGTALRRKESISTRWFFLVNPTAALRHSRPRGPEEIVEVSL